MNETFTLKLLLLECVQEQELDGDELYITLDDQRVWAAIPDKGHHHPTQPNQVSAFDFENGRKGTKDGWQIATFDPTKHIFSDLTGEHTLKLWDADTFSSDDLLGEMPVSINDAGRGKIQLRFEKDGGHYRLTLVVE